MLLENLALDYFMRGVVRGRFGNAHPRLHPYNLVRAADGWVVVAAATPASWTDFGNCLASPTSDSMTLPSEPPIGISWTRRSSDSAGPRTVEELERLGRENDTAISRVYRIDEIARDPHFQERGMFLEWQDPVAGAVKGAGGRAEVPHDHRAESGAVPPGWGRTMRPCSAGCSSTQPPGSIPPRGRNRWSPSDLSRNPLERRSLSGSRRDGPLLGPARRIPFGSKSNSSRGHTILRNAPGASIPIPNSPGRNFGRWARRDGSG